MPRAATPECGSRKAPGRHYNHTPPAATGRFSLMPYEFHKPFGQEFITPPVIRRDRDGGHVDALGVRNCLHVSNERHALLRAYLCR